ncbi:hypothetical protein [Pasteurella multocida]|uniref:hypothetical protein n=1 Tax=Pasteurella multocida TaxID=747 RepID=UPI00227A3F82|nr:hypothetical protein [Pasteurella multocida]WAJ40874.1 hypothetical protein OR605_09545 [Pasteurella multocida]
MKVSKMLKQAKRLRERQKQLCSKKQSNRINAALIDVPVKAKKLSDIAITTAIKANLALIQ